MCQKYRFSSPTVAIVVIGGRNTYITISPDDVVDIELTGETPSLLAAHVGKQEIFMFSLDVRKKGLPLSPL
jgi:hypothetical protein